MNFIKWAALAGYVLVGLIIAQDLNDRNTQVCGRPMAMVDVAATALLWLPIGVIMVVAPGKVPMGNCEAGLA